MDESDDVVCEICHSGDSLPENRILFCDGDSCNVTVHQECYGVAQVPKGDWLCATCEAHIKAGTAACALCHRKGGALKSVASDGSDSPAKAKRGRAARWAHVLCAMWVPETHFGDEDGVDLIQVRPAHSVRQSSGGLDALVACTLVMPRGCLVSPRCGHRRCSDAAIPCELSPFHVWLSAVTVTPLVPPTPLLTCRSHVSSNRALTRFTPSA